MKPSHIKITVPSTATVGDKIRAIVDVRNPDETTSKYFFGRIVFEPTHGIDMPLEHNINKGEEGRFIVEDINLKARGIFRIRAVFRKESISGESNPIRVSEKREQYGIYWADIHGHSALSDGMGTPDEYYTFARDVAGLDICAITDHDVYPQTLSKENWEKLKNAAQKFYEPDKFVTFLAYEWTAGQYFTKGPASGHHCVYFLDDYEHAKLYQCSNPETNTLDKLWSKYRDANVITVPHHTAVNSPTFWYGWEHKNDKMQRLVEIYSTWGSSEMSNERKNTRMIRRLGGMVPKHSGKTIQEALAKGFKFGFIGGSDGHDGRPGDSNSYINDPPLIATLSGVHEGHLYSGGITAVLAKELTREAVWDALKNRRVYATTGTKILVDFSINGALMGSEIEMSKKDDPVLKIHVSGTAPIKKISIVRNNHDIYSDAPKKEEAKFTFIDREKKGGVSYYYLRIIQTDGHIAWSSPIWITRPEKRFDFVRKAIKAKTDEFRMKRFLKKETRKIARAHKKAAKKKTESKT